MSSVRLTRRLDLEERQNVPDGAGGFSVEWVRLGTLWAEVDARSGRENQVAGRDLPLTAYRIIVRAAPVGAPSRPKADQRLREGTRVFSILAVAEHDTGGRYLTCYAEEGSAA